MMKTRVRKGVMLIAIAIIACLAFGLVACTKPAPSDPVLSGISITNKTELTAEWHAGEADRTITVSLTPESIVVDNTEITVTSNGAAVTVDTDDKFKLHAAAEGTATVTVAVGEFTDSVEISVKRAIPPLVGITVNKAALEAEWYIGEADRTVTVTYDPASDYNATNTPATVTSDKPEIVKVDGMKLKAVGAGTANITVTAGGKTATATVTVKPVLESITLSAEAHEYMTVGEADKQVTFTVLPASITDAFVTFASSNEAVAKVEKVDDKYMLKAISKGTAKITATVKTANAKEGTKTAEFDVTVRSALESVTLTALGDISVTEKAATLYVNEQKNATLTLAPSDEYNAENTKYELSLSENDGVLALTNDGKGVKALKAGTAKVTVTAGDKTDTVTVTVWPVLTGVEIAGVDEATYYKGDEIKISDLQATLSPNGITEEYDESLTFEITSSDETVAEIVKNETTQLPEKIAFVGTGDVTVTLRFFVTDNERAGEAVKTVTKTVTAVGVSFADSSKVTLAIGEKSTREASVTPDTYNAVYSVKDGSTDVITVNAATGEVTAIAVGTKTIVATVQGGATAEYEVEVKVALSSITVNNVTTFNSDIDYGSENIELDIMLDNGYTFNSAEISVIASDTDYVSVINTDGKYYAVINKITYGTEKSNGVTIEIKSNRFTSVTAITLTVKVAATAPVIELASEAEISAFAGDVVKLPAITTSKKCDDGDIAPTVTVKKGTNEVVDVYDASNNTVTCAETGEDYTVTYTITDDRAASPLTISKTINVKLYRKVFKAVTGRKVYDYPEAVLDFEYAEGAKYTADSEQKLSIQESNTVLGQFNMTASKYYYAEAMFTLKNPSGNSFVGLSHSLPVDSGTPTRWLAAMVDRGDRNFKIKDIDMTDETGKKEGNPDCFNYNLKDVLYRNQLVNFGGLKDGDVHTVKVAVARADEYFYTFVNDQFVMVNTDKDYSEPTVPGIFGIKLGDNEAGVTIGSISWVEGSDATNTKLTSLYSDKYFGYHKWDKGPSFDKDDNGFITSNDVGTSEDGANGCYMSSGITPYVVFDGDFKVEYDYTNTKAEYAAVRWTRGALLNIVSALSHTDVGQQQVMASVGVRITGDNATSGNNVVYHGSPAMQESGVPFNANDVDLSGSGDNQASFTDNNFVSNKPYTTLAVHNNESIHFSVERRLKSDHAEYMMKITVNGNTVTRVMDVNCAGWSDPVMFMWGNQSNHGTVSNIGYQTISA